MRDLHEQRQLAVALFSQLPVGIEEFLERDIPGLSIRRVQSAEAIVNLPAVVEFFFAERVFEKALDQAAGELPIDDSSDGGIRLLR